MSVLFVQKRPIRAGAQTSLARMAASTSLRHLRPAVLLGGEGWLSEQLQRQGTPVLATEFPSPRSLKTRILGLAGFASRTKSLLEKNGVGARAIVANDHQECPLALALSRAFGGVPVLGILRTPGMTQNDFGKYLCEQCDGLMGEGAELRARITGWTRKPVALFEEGFTEDEFMPVKPWPEDCPRRVLVAGSEAPRKGFTDFIEAVARLEDRLPEFPGFICELTGAQPEGAASLLARPLRSSFRFIGRVEGFANLVRQYDLAVHPSRAETFGMAPIEALLAGTPTLVSVTGVVAQLDMPSAWTFPPGDIPALTDRLAALWTQWQDLKLDLACIQGQIRRSYHIDHTAGFVRQGLAALGIS